MKRYLIALGLAILGVSPAFGQNTTVGVVSTCGTLPTSYMAGRAGPPTVDTNGNLCIGGTISSTATIAPFAPTAQAALNVTAVTGNVALPGGSNAILCNSGTNTIYYKFGVGAGTTAAVTDIKLPSGICIADAVGANTYVAAITASGTATLDITGGAGMPTFSTIPSLAAVYHATPIVLTDGQSAQLQLDADGGLKAYAPDITTTGNITTQNLNLGGAATAGSAVSTYLDARGTTTVQVTGTWTGTLVAQVTDDGTNWVTIGTSPFLNENTGAFSTNISSGSTGLWNVVTSGHQQMRITASAAVTGTAVVTINASQQPTQVSVAYTAGGGAGTSSSFGAAFPAIGTAAGAVVVSTPSTYTAGNMNALNLSTAGRLFVDGSGVTQPVSGTVATNAETTIAPGTAPTKAFVGGGVYTATAPTLTDGQTAALRLDADGALIAYAPDSTVTGNITTQNLVPGGAATAGSAVTYNGDGRGSISIQVTGTYTGALTLQETVDGTNWITIAGSPLYNDVTGAYNNTITSGSVGVWTAEIAGRASIRLTALGAVTGTAVVTMHASQGVNRVDIGYAPYVTTIGPAANAAAAAGNPNLVAGWNGTNAYTLRTDTSGQLLLGATANIVGKVGIDQTTPGTTNLVATNADSSIAPGTAPAKAIVSGGVYNSTPPTLTNGQTAATQLDVDGSLYVNVRDQTIQRTYRAGMVGLVPAAAATDVFGVCGSGTKTIIITRLQATGIATSATTADAVVLKRSTADTLGTSTAPALVPLDSGSAAATATVLGYTANPTVGTLVGNISSQKIVLTTAAAASQMYPMLQYWPNNITQGLTLRGTAECAYLNLNGQTIAGNSLNVDVEWIETP